MNIEELRVYCLSIKGCNESLPFLKHNVPVFKVMNKMFAYISLEPKDGVFKVNLKCNPDKSVDIALRIAAIDIAMSAACAQFVSPMLRIPHLRSRFNGVF